MTTLSVITAVDPALAAWLPATAASVHAAAGWLAGQGVGLEWVVVVDGPGKLPKYRSGEYLTLRRVAYPAGPAAAKNLALAIARGDWVLDLAADEELYAGGLAELLRHTGMAAVAWASPASAPLDGETTGAGARTAVAYQPGQLARAWHTGLGFDPRHLLVRRAAALEVGGWPAVPAEENLALLLAVAERHPGAAVPHTVFRTRTWEGQRPRAHGWAETLTEARWTIAALLNARRAAAGNLEPVQPPRRARTGG